MARRNASLDNEPVSATLGESGGDGSGDTPVSISADGSIVVNPAEIGGNNANAGNDSGTGDGTRRKRGPKPGSKRTPKAAPLTVTGIELLLFNVHAMLASATKEDALAINDIQAETLAKSIANVQRHYNSVLSEKHIDWFNLVSVAGTMYGAMFLAIRGKRIAARAEKVDKPDQMTFPAFQSVKAA